MALLKINKTLKAAFGQQSLILLQISSIETLGQLNVIEEVGWKEWICLK